MSLQVADGMSNQYDFRRMADEEHRRAELLRLGYGQDGCGCLVCQEFYGTLDLSEYGGRVKRQGRLTYIVGKQEPPDHWTPDGLAFITGGKRYGVSPNGQTICFGAADTVQNDHQTVQEGAEPRHRIADGTLLLSALTQNTGSTKPKGRKPLDIPTDKVLEMAAAGATNRVIAAKLGVSRETIRRILAGERALQPMVSRGFGRSLKTVGFP